MLKSCCPVLVGVFDCGRLVPQASIWTHLLTADGDVEANPGPSPDGVQAFALFISQFSDGFASLLEPIKLHRRVIQLKMELLQRKITAEQFCEMLAVDALDLDLVLQHVAVFEQYAQVGLNWSAEGVSWTPVPSAPDSEEVKALRDELERLRIQLNSYMAQNRWVDAG